MVTINLTDNQAKIFLATLAQKVENPVVRTRCAVYINEHPGEFVEVVNSVMMQIVEQGIHV